MPYHRTHEISHITNLSELGKRLHEIGKYLLIFFPQVPQNF